MGVDAYEARLRALEERAAGEDAIARGDAAETLRIVYGAQGKPPCGCGDAESFTDPLRMYVAGLLFGAFATWWWMRERGAP